MEEFPKILSELEEVLKPLYEYKAKKTQDDLLPIEKAEVNVTIAYVVYSLYHLYLKSQGIDIETHPFSKELIRMKQYMNKVGAAKNLNTEDQKSEETKEEKEVIIVDEDEDVVEIQNTAIISEKVETTKNGQDQLDVKKRKRKNKENQMKKKKH